jgi:hypothetical protein
MFLRMRDSARKSAELRNLRIVRTDFRRRHARNGEEAGLADSQSIVARFASIPFDVMRADSFKRKAVNVGLPNDLQYCWIVGYGCSVYLELLSLRYGIAFRGTVEARWKSIAGSTEDTKFQLATELVSEGMQFADQKPLALGTERGIYAPREYGLALWLLVHTPGAPYYAGSDERLPEMAQKAEGSEMHYCLMTILAAKRIEFHEKFGQQLASLRIGPELVADSAPPLSSKLPVTWSEQPGFYEEGLRRRFNNGYFKHPLLWLTQDMVDIAASLDRFHAWDLKHRIRKFHVEARGTVEKGQADIRSLLLETQDLLTRIVEVGGALDLERRSLLRLRDALIDDLFGVDGGESTRAAAIEYDRVAEANFPIFRRDDPFLDAEELTPNILSSSLSAIDIFRKSFAAKGVNFGDECSRYCLELLQGVPRHAKTPELPDLESRLRAAGAKKEQVRDICAVVIARQYLDETMVSKVAHEGSGQPMVANPRRFLEFVAAILLVLLSLVLVVWIDVSGRSGIGVVDATEQGIGYLAVIGVVCFLLAMVVVKGWSRRLLVASALIFAFELISLSVH